LIAQRKHAQTDAPPDRQRSALKDALETILVLRDENQRLREELAALKRNHPQSKGDGLLAVASYEADGIGASSSAELKLALFRGLFRGREDVYAARWERHDGRSGYSPALRLGAPRGPGVTHEPGDYLPLTPAALRNHLTGGVTIGVYPLLTDDTCWFVAMDFDKASWRDDAQAAMGIYSDLRGPPRWSDPGQAKVPTCGCFSIDPSQPTWRGTWPVRCSHKHSTGATRLASIRTIGCSRVRTLYPEVASAT